MSTTSLPTAAQLLSPFTVDAFARQFDNKSPVMLRPVLSTPLDLPSLDRFVADAGLRWPTVHLEDDDGPVHPDSYTHSVQWGTGREHHLVDTDALHAGLLRGWRVVFPELQRHHGPTAALARTYERAFHMRGSATAVLSPRDAAVRTVPDDGVHRYLLQCHGTRTCTVAAPDQPPESFEVVVGCALYVPPGHSVTTAPMGGPSLSVDLSLRPIRVQDLAAAELTAFSHDGLRDPLPMGLGRDPSTLAAEWADLVERMLDEADHQETLETLVDSFVQSRLPLLRGQLTADTAEAAQSAAHLELLDSDGIVRAAVPGNRQPDWLPLGAAATVRLTCEAPSRLLYRLRLV